MDPAGSDLLQLPEAALQLIWNQLGPKHQRSQHALSSTCRYLRDLSSAWVPPGLAIHESSDCDGSA